MINIDDILKIDSEQVFREVALRVFQFQAVNNPVYAQYLNLIGVEPSSVTDFNSIPYLPIELFKGHEVCSGCLVEGCELTFSSSGTTGSVPSYHYVKEAEVYEKSFLKAFELFYDKVEDCNIYALLPSYLEREGSSLIYMITKLIDKCYDGGFFLYNHEELLGRIAKRDKSKKTILFGVSFALLDMSEEYKVDFNDEVIVMETGGMKGRREELPRHKLHELLQKSLGVSAIHSEYGMCECLSQSYSYGEGVFMSPSWMRIVIRDLHNPFKQLTDGMRGGVNIVDLANIYSCSFLQTQDLGQTYHNGTFTIEGRIDNSEIRGCNLLVQ